MRFAAYLAAFLFLAQQASIRVDVNLQQVSFVVRDGGGGAVAALDPRDIVVEENGIRQAVTRVVRESESPVSFVLLINVPSLQTNIEMRDAAITIGRDLVRQMKPHDEIVLMTTLEARQILARQDIGNQTQDVDSVLTGALGLVDPKEKILSRGAALSRALEAAKKSKHRARALIVITFAPWEMSAAISPDGLSRAVGSEREVPIYFFDVGGAVDESHVDPRAVSHTRLSMFGFQTERNVEFWENPFTEETGGHAFHFDFNSRSSAMALAQLNDFVQQMNRDLRTTQTLEYYSSVPHSSARRIRIQHTSPDYRIYIRRSALQMVDADDRSVARVSSISSAKTTALNPGRSALGSEDFVQVRPGEFLMGCAQNDLACYAVHPDPQNVGGTVLPNARRINPWRVRIDKPFEIGKYEVSQSEWKNIMGTNPSYFRGDDRPVENVSWREIQEFLKRMNDRKDGYRYRLPSEEEWEYVAREGRSGPYEGSLDSTSWYIGNSGRQTHAVGTKAANAWGVHDMYGNVFEWLEDSNDDKPWDFGRYGGKRFRGGSWLSTSLFSRTSFRMGLPPDSRLSTLGFRLVREKR